MKTELRKFFGSMEGYLLGAEGMDGVYAAYPGWEPPRGRLGIYGRFVRHHVDTVVDKLYPLAREVVGKGVGAERWEELKRGYRATRPGRHFELNRVGEGFAAHMADEAGRLGLPEWVPALARFEWTDFAVYASEEAVPREVERLTVNPTLAALQHPWGLCEWVRHKGEGTPRAVEETALLWRHPEKLVTMFMAASPGALLAVKMALEGLTVAAVAAATGGAEADIHASVARCVADGLVLAPAKAGG